MAVKTRFSKKDFIDILLKYNLGDYKNSTPITKGTVQTNYLLETVKTKIVFRYYEIRSKEYVLFEASLIKYLKNKGYPCPNLFKSRQGKYVGIHNKKPYALLEFIEGVHIKNPTEAQWKEVIKKVAELQILIKNYKPVYKDARLNYSPELCEKLAKEEAKEIGGKDSKEKFEWVRKELLKLKLPASLPKGICHCDFDFSNILFKNNKFAALLDFDDANYTFQIFDLVGLIERWAWPHNKTMDFGRAKKVIEEYSKHRPLNNKEKKHLFDVYKLSILFDCIWFFKRGKASDFNEKRKIDYLNNVGRRDFYEKLFS